MLYYHCVRDISWSLLFSTRVMNIAVLDVYGFQTCFGSAASAFENIELADIHCALKMNFSVTLRVCLATQLLNILTCVSLIYRELLVLGNWKVHQENRNHDWSKKWLQQNSRYAVKLIAKGGFISASRSKELNLQLQLQIKFNLSMRKTILWSTIYPVLTQAIFKEISWPEYWSVLLNK